ncbi:Zn-ribbon domain-containing OB-fold protein [Geodermatophilus sp. URMC 64]
MPDPAPVDATLFASLDPPRLAGSRCDACGTVTFPASGSCPKCPNPAMAPYALPDRGTVWTWTVQGFAPKAPYVPPAAGFRPFPVGYVDLGEVLVESHLLADPQGLRIGLPVRLVLEPAWETDGAPVVTYAFAPEEDA